MTKNEFLQALYNHLSPLTPTERDEIIADFEEHFSAGLERGKSEEQICAELGNPYTCALQYLRTAQTQTPPPPQNTARPAQNPMYGAQPQTASAPPVRRANMPWAIAFFIAVFLAIGIYPACAAMILSPIAIVIAAIFAEVIVPMGAAVVGLLISVAVMLCAAGVFGLLVMTWFLKLSYKRAEF